MSRNLHKVNMINIMINFISYCVKIKCSLLFNVNLDYLNKTVQKKWEGWLNDPKIWYLLTLMVHLGKKTRIYCKCVCVWVYVHVCACIYTRKCACVHANTHHWQTGWKWDMDGFGSNLGPLAELVNKCAKSLGSVTAELFGFQIFKIIYTSACHLVRIGMNGSSNKRYKDQFTDKEGDTL